MNDAGFDSLTTIEIMHVYLGDCRARSPVTLRDGLKDIMNTTVVFMMNILQSQHVKLFSRWFLSENEVGFDSLTINDSIIILIVFAECVSASKAVLYLKMEEEKVFPSSMR